MKNIVIYAYDFSFLFIIETGFFIFMIKSHFCGTKSSINFNLYKGISFHSYFEDAELRQYFGYGW